MGLFLSDNRAWGEPVTIMLMDYLGASTTGGWSALSHSVKLAAAEAHRGALGARVLAGAGEPFLCPEHQLQLCSPALGHFKALQVAELSVMGYSTASFNKQGSSRQVSGLNLKPRWKHEVSFKHRNRRFTEEERTVSIIGGEDYLVHLFDALESLFAGSWCMPPVKFSWFSSPHLALLCFLAL